ncbi:hypothetical protein ACUHMQ_18605 [Chitinimonas sp. PSY-7]|uniref:hypothetical protein n=1 Tax=Chitinimonas sp. PSY-7 TaxID=3459088 RepID=UPI0040400A16
MQRDTRWNWRQTDVTRLDLKDKQVAIVGGTGGIGRALSRFLAERGANVLVIGQIFRDMGVSGVKFIQADLSLMQEAQRVSALLPAETLDLVIFTTGIFAAPQRQETAEGIERDLAVSYLNRLVILNAIAPKLGIQRTDDSTPPRVFIVGYPGAGQIGTPDDLNTEKSYKAMSAHRNTVAGNEMLVLDVAKHYPRLRVFGLNPGLIKTHIRDNLLGKGSWKSRVIESLIGLLAPAADDYAQRIAPLLVTPGIDGHSGSMFNSKGQAILPSQGLTLDHISKFMATSRALVARAGVAVVTS